MTTPRSATSGQKRELNKQLKEVVDEMGLTFDQATILLAKGGTWKGKTKDAAQQLLSSDLIEFVTFAQANPVERFSVAEVIKTGRIGNTRFWFSDDFQRIFGLLVETDVPAVVMKAFQLKKRSVDGPILEELGGAEQARSYITHIIALACQQGQGQEGVLLTKDYRANIFYVPNPNNPEEFWAVYCIWYSGSGDWRLSAYPVTIPGKWGADIQVFSRDSDS